MTRRARLIGVRAVAVWLAAAAGVVVCLHLFTGVAVGQAGEDATQPTAGPAVMAPMAVPTAASPDEPAANAAVDAEPTPAIQPPKLGGSSMLRSRTGAAVVPTRVVALYDFEDKDDAGMKIGASLSHAPHWYPIGRDPQESDPAFLRQPLHQLLGARRHYPDYNDVRMDNAAAKSGEYALFLRMRGGNVGAFVEVGSVPAVPGSNYVVSAQVRTHKLEHAGAVVTAYYVDSRGNRLEQTATKVGPIKTAGRWERVALSLPGEFREAAWIGLEVEVLQPVHIADHPLGNEQVIRPDIEGGAWFDDIVVWQVPHVRISTQSKVNIIRAPQQPRLSVSVRDLAGQRLMATATVYDQDMRPVITEQRRVGAGSPGKWEWTPKLPGYGWYRVDLTTQETEGPMAGQVIARAGGAFCWLEPKRSMRPGDRPRFGIVAEDLPQTELDLVDDVLLASSIHAVTVSAFNPRTTLAQMDDDQLGINNAIERLLMGGRHVTLSLEPVPIELTQSLGLDVADAMAAMTQAPEPWLAYLTPVVMRHGQRVRHWQLGSTLQPDAFFRGDLSGASADILATFKGLAPDPTLILPWSVDQSPRPDVTPGYAYAARVPAGVVPRNLSSYLERWASPGQRLTLELDAPPADQVRQSQRVRDTVLRMLHAWEHNPAGLSLRRPWAVAGNRKDTLVPDPRLGVFTTVAHRLAGRQVIGRLALVPGVECLILDGPAGGMLVVWNGQAPADTPLSLYLGANPKAHDAWGNPVALSFSDGRHSLAVPKTPIFIEGIDAELAMFRASFKITPPLIESKQGAHRRTITLSNPFKRTISGRLLITGPEGWRTSPHTHFFSIAAGKTVQLPVALSFPIVEVAGHKELTARAVFRAEQPYDIELSAPMELGLPGIDYHATMALVEGKTPGTTDAVVSTVVTNTGEDEVSLYVFASLAGHPRQERPIPSLEPGQSAVRSFRFANVGKAIKEFPIRSGVRENNGPAILNHLLKATPQ